MRFATQHSSVSTLGLWMPSDSQVVGEFDLHDSSTGAVSSSRHIPTWVIILLLTCLAIGLVMMFWGGFVGGVTWDEKTHVLMLQTFIDQGWNVSPDALKNGIPDPSYVWGVYVYGPVGELVSHLTTILIGEESWGSTSLSARAYAGRHLGVGLMGLIGIVSVALTMRVWSKSWKWALLAGAILSTTPLWVGHSMFNIKDVPVAAGCALSVLGISTLLATRFREQRGVHLWGLAALLLGTVLAAGTRAAIGVLVAACLVIGIMALWLLTAFDGTSGFTRSTKAALAKLGEGLGTLILGYLLLVVIYPKAFINPFVLAWEALVVSARFPFDEAVLTSGTWVQQPPSWSYLPHWYLAQLPILILVGVTIMSVVLVVQAVRLLARKSSNLKPTQLAIGAVVLAQAFALPLIAIVGKSNMYNGSRQFLFVVPAFALLAAMAIWCLAGVVQGKRPWLRVALWVAVALGVAVPTVSQVTLFPYNYTWLNGVTASQPIEGMWPTDYWRQSARELIARTPQSGTESCRYEQGRKGELHSCKLEPMFIPFADERGTLAKPGSLEPGQYWLIWENQGLTDIPEGCTLQDEITKRLFLQSVVIGQIAKCDQMTALNPAD
jgi:hypothetical protein